MRARALTFFFIGLSAVVSQAAACSSDELGCDEDGCSGQGPTGDSDFGSGPSSSSAGPTSGSGASNTGDGNDSFETAEAIELNDVQAQDLSPVGDVDFYSFTGKKGQVLLFDIDAQDADNKPFDPSYIDTILTVFDSQQRQLAEATAPIPRYSGDPQLYTILPEDGTYYLRISECWQWSQSAEDECAPPEAKEHVAYTLLAVDVQEVRLTGLTIVGEVEPNSDAATATQLAYEKSAAGIYYYTDLYGTFGEPADVDGFRFVLPEDTAVTTGRATATFWPLPDGVSGNGSSAPPGKIYLVDPLAAPGTRWAEIDASLGQRLGPPVELGHEYLLFVEPIDGAGGADDFYFIRHYGSGSNPLEAADTANTSFASAEALTAEDTQNGAFSFYVDGDVIPAGADIDHYVLDAAVVPDGGRVSVYCSAERRGSGLRELDFALLAGSSGSELASATETATEDAAILDVPIPSGEDELVLKVTAGAQATNVTSSFYRCGIHLYPPP